MVFYYTMKPRVFVTSLYLHRPVPKQLMWSLGLAVVALVQAFGSDVNLWIWSEISNHLLTLMHPETGNLLQANNAPPKAKQVESNLVLRSSHQLCNVSRVAYMYDATLLNVNFPDIFLEFVTLSWSMLFCFSIWGDARIYMLPEMCTTWDLTIASGVTTLLWQRVTVSIKIPIITWAHAEIIAIPNSDGFSRTHKHNDRSNTGQEGNQYITCQVVGMHSAIFLCIQVRSHILILKQQVLQSI